MTEKIRNTIDNGNYGCGIFIEIKKAFDTVNHSILLRKLDHYGIRGISLQWFESYLSNRNQYVSVNGHASEQLSITHGVPQRSVLGLILFLIFINDLPKVSKFLNFYLFADDTNIYYESSDLLNIQKNVNRELRKVRQWLEANRLALNIDKTNFVLFHSSQRSLTEHIVLKIGNKKLKQEGHVRFLGVLPLVGSSTSLNCQKTCKNSWSFLQNQALCSKRHTNASLSCYLCPIFDLWGISLEPDLSINVRFYFCSTKKDFKDSNI